jgi:hypothetical protein
MLIKINVGKFVIHTIRPNRAGVALTPLPASLVPTILTGTCVVSDITDTTFKVTAPGAAEIGTLEVVFDVDLGAGPVTTIEVHDLVVYESGTPAVAIRSGLSYGVEA